MSVKNGLPPPIQDRYNSTLRRVLRQTRNGSAVHLNGQPIVEVTAKDAAKANNGGHQRGQAVPYILTQQQRWIVLVIHQNGPQTIEQLVKRQSKGFGDSSIRSRLNRCINESLLGTFVRMREDDGAFKLTPRAEEIAGNITAAGGATAS